MKLPKETYTTDIHWFPTSGVGSKKQSSQSDLFVLACTDGNHVHVYNVHVIHDAYAQTRHVD